MEKDKSSLYRVLSLFMLVVIVLGIYSFFWGPIARYSASLYSARTLSVSAAEEVYATPDVAQLSFSVVTEGTDISNITDKNNEKMNAAIATLKEHGIAQEDIQTTQYTLSPVYTQPGRDFSGTFISSIAKYRISQSVQVKIRNFDVVSSVISELPQKGINEISGLSFTVDEPEQYQEEAREKAFEKAREKALAIAHENGVSLGRLMNISESSDVPYPMYRGVEAYGLGGAADSKLSAPTIEPGTQKISVYVNLSYELR